MHTLQTSQFKNLLLMLVLAGIFYSCKSETKFEPPAKTETPPVENKKTEKSSSGNNFIVKYDLTGKMNGKITIFRKDNILKQEINSEFMGVKTSNQVYVLDDFVYSISEADGNKFGSKTKLEDFSGGKNAGDIITNFREFEKFISTKKVIGTESILGFTCEIYEIGNGTELSIYDKKYILKIKNPAFTAIATKLEPNPVFSEDEFIVPKYTEFKKTDPSDIRKDILDSLMKKPKK